MKITNKFKIIYGYIVLFMLFISTIIPYHKITHLDYTKTQDKTNPETIIKYKSILFNPIPINIIILIIICIIGYIIINNNKIYKKKSKKKLIKPKWILINTIILCYTAIGMEIEIILQRPEYQQWCGLNTWCGPIGISNLTTTRLPGFYLYIISLILLFIYWIINKKYMSDKD